MLTPSTSLTEENFMNIVNSIWDTRTRSVLVLSALAFGLVGAAGIGASAAATDDGAVLKTTVRYARGDLATDGGARALYRRLTIAADQVCPQSSGSPFVGMEVRRCRENAVRQAVLQINDPRLGRVLAAMTSIERVRGQAHPIEHDSRRIKPVNSGG
jgi:UrcA family protein